jgi:hypothetical protein
MSSFLFDDDLTIKEDKSTQVSAENFQNKPNDSKKLMEHRVNYDLNADDHRSKRKIDFRSDCVRNVIISSHRLRMNDVEKRVHDFLQSSNF